MNLLNYKITIIYPKKSILTIFNFSVPINPKGISLHASFSVLGDLW